MTSAVNSHSRDNIQLFVLSGADAPELKGLSNLPQGVKLLGTGRPEIECKSKTSAHASLRLCTLEHVHLCQLRAGWGQKDWSKVEVLLKCGTGKDASTKQELQVPGSF